MAYTDEVLADLPIAYWRLDEASGSVAEDSSGNNRDGAYQHSPLLNQATLLVTGGGKSVDFVGDSWVRLANAGWQDPPEFTVEFWMEFSGIGNEGIWFKGGHSTVTVNGPRGSASTVLRINVPSNITTIGGFVASQTYYMVITHEIGVGTRIYIDGVLNTTLTADTGAAESSSDHLFIGADEAETSDSFNGRLDEVAFYNYALSATRIGVHYSWGTGAIAPPVQPTISVVDVGVNTVSLQGSAYSDPNGDPHTASQWQVLRADTGEVLFDSGLDTVNLTSIVVSDLPADTELTAKVRYEDSTDQLSPYSTPASFTTELWAACPPASSTTLTECEDPLSLTSSPYADLVASFGPHLYWRLNEQAGSVVDDSGPNDFDGTASGDVILGRVGLFPGSLISAELGVGEVFQDETWGGLNQFGFLIWISLQDVSGFNRIAGVGGSWELYVEDGILFWRIYDTTAQGFSNYTDNTVILPNTVYFVGGDVTLSLLTNSIYVNGVRVHHGSGPGGHSGFPQAGNPFFLGDATGNLGITGLLDEAVIFEADTNEMINIAADLYAARNSPEVQSLWDVCPDPSATVWSAD